MNDEQQNQVWLRQLIRIYVTGLIVTAIALFIWKRGSIHAFGQE